MFKNKNKKLFLILFVFLSISLLFQAVKASEVKDKNKIQLELNQKIIAYNKLGEIKLINSKEEIEAEEKIDLKKDEQISLYKTGSGDVFAMVESSNSKNIDFYKVFIDKNLKIEKIKGIKGDRDLNSFYFEDEEILLAKKDGLYKLEDSKEKLITDKIKPKAVYRLSDEFILAIEGESLKKYSNVLDNSVEIYTGGEIKDYIFTEEYTYLINDFASDVNNNLALKINNKTNQVEGLLELKDKNSYFAGINKDLVYIGQPTRIKEIFIKDDFIGRNEYKKELLNSLSVVVNGKLYEIGKEIKSKNLESLKLEENKLKGEYKYISGN